MLARQATTILRSAMRQSARKYSFRHSDSFAASLAASALPSGTYFARLVLRLPPLRMRLAQRAAYGRP